MVSPRTFFNGPPQEGRGDHGFLRYTFSPTFSSRSATETFPSVLAMMIVLPEDDGPNSLLRSTLIVRMFPSTVMSTFFKLPPFCLCIASTKKRPANGIPNRSALLKSGLLFVVNGSDAPRQFVLTFLGI